MQPRANGELGAERRRRPFIDRGSKVTGAVMDPGQALDVRLLANAIAVADELIARIDESAVTGDHESRGGV